MGYPPSPRSTAEIDAWMATAVSVLQGNKGSGERGKGKKRVKLLYQWVDHVDRLNEVVRTEDVEVE